MNPPTDVGKKDLPDALRSRFTEIFVDEMEGQGELLEVVSGVLGTGASMQLSARVVDFYLEARALAAKGKFPSPNPISPDSLCSSPKL